VAECQTQLQTAEEALRIYSKKEGDGLMELLEDAATQLERWRDRRRIERRDRMRILKRYVK
jgi:hypothetical protein